MRNAMRRVFLRADTSIVNVCVIAGVIAAKASPLRAFGAFRAISFSDQGSIRAKFKRAFPPVVLQI